MPSGNVVPILDISPKQVYQIFLQQKQIAPTAKQKLSNKYSNIDIDWEKAYTLAFHCTLPMLSPKSIFFVCEDFGPSLHLTTWENKIRKCSKMYLVLD